MKYAIGNDIIANKRIRDVYSTYGDRFLSKIYTSSEIRYCLKKKDPIPHLAARFACKEAVIKALDTCPESRVDMREIELIGDQFGKKTLSLNGKSKELFTLRGFSGAQVSISHCEEYSTAVVLLYKD
jgi:holo-[acyl-carrier protein] synthase